MRGRPRLSGEAGLIVSGLIKAIVFFILFAIVLADGGSIMFARLRVDDVATGAAIEAADSFKKTGDVNAARESAKAIIHERDDDALLTGFTVDPGSGAVTVTVTKQAPTLFVRHFSFSRKWALARASETALPPALS